MSVLYLKIIKIVKKKKVQMIIFYLLNHVQLAHFFGKCHLANKADQKLPGFQKKKKKKGTEPE